MKPVKFEESNVVYGEGQEGVEPLPALKFESGEVVSCWKLSWKELLRLIWKREIWACVQTHNKPLQPMFMTARKEEMLETT